VIESDFDAGDLAHKVSHFFRVAAGAGVDDTAPVRLRQKSRRKLSLAFTSGVEKTSSVRFARLKPVTMRAA
jgi:hypothetical protein